MTDIRALVADLRHMDTSATAGGTYSLTFRRDPKTRELTELVAFEASTDSSEEARTWGVTRAELLSAGQWATAGRRFTSMNDDGYQITDPNELALHAVD